MTTTVKAIENNKFTNQFLAEKIFAKVLAITMTNHDVTVSLSYYGKIQCFDIYIRSVITEGLIYKAEFRFSPLEYEPLLKDWNELVDKNVNILKMLDSWIVHEVEHEQSV
jgi:hypothetical protein